MKIVVANFKNFGNNEFFENYKLKLNNLKTKDTKIILCPPFVYASNFYDFNLAYQNVDLDLKEIDKNIKYAILGHYDYVKNGESYQDVKNKFEFCSKHGIKPIVCVTDSEADEDFLIKELSNKIIPTNEEVVIAYEPNYLIGSDKDFNENRLLNSVDLIKDFINRNKLKAKIIFGGNVNVNNYKKFLSFTDGLILGRACLNIDDFIKIIEGVDNE